VCVYVTCASDSDGGCCEVARHALGFACSERPQGRESCISANAAHR